MYAMLPMLMNLVHLIINFASLTYNNANVPFVKYLLTHFDIYVTQNNPVEDYTYTCTCKEEINAVLRIIDLIVRNFIKTITRGILPCRYFFVIILAGYSTIYK